MSLKKSLHHLKRDKKLSKVIRKYGVIPTDWGRRPRGAFESLAKSIVYQQISGKAADSIIKKFLSLFPGRQFPRPEKVLGMSLQKLNGAGLSPQKTGYITGLAKKFSDGTVSPRNFHRMSDDDITRHLLQVKGIGPWTCHMFLMFTLKRPDVLPTGDLGIQKGFRRLFGLRALPTPERMQKLSAPWAGHRTVASLYLWKMVDGK